MLHHRYWPGMADTLEALLAQSTPPTEVVVVDNASDQHSRSAIGERFPDVRIVASPENVGYSAGMNLGIASLDRDDLDAVLLLTHDCVLAENAVEQLTERLNSNGRVGAVGPLIARRSDPTAVFSAGGRIDGPGWNIRHGRSPNDVGSWSDRPPHVVDWIDGCCMAIRTEALADVGPLDERYFLYYEDVDYGLRLREAGWSVECVPAAVAWQEPGRLSVYLFTKNRLRLLSTYAPRPLVASEVVRGIGRSVNEIVTTRASRESLLRAVGRARATWEFVRGLKTEPERVLMGGYYS